MKAVEIQPEDDVVRKTAGPGFKFGSVIVMETRRTVKKVEVDSTRNLVRLTFWATDGVEEYALDDEIEVERHA